MGNALRKNKLPIVPTGIYAEFFWDRKVARNLIRDRKVAPFFPPSEDSCNNSEECPICFMNFIGGLNWCVRCKKRVCSECYFQVRRPTTQSKCPLCMHEPFEVRFTGPLSQDEVKRQRIEEKKVKELLDKKSQQKVSTPLQKEAELSKATQEKVKEKDFFEVTPDQPTSPSTHLPDTNLEPLFFGRLPRRYNFNNPPPIRNHPPIRHAPIRRFQPPPRRVERRQSPPVSNVDNFVPRHMLNGPDAEDRMLKEAIRLSLQESSNLPTSINDDEDSVSLSLDLEEEGEDEIVEIEANNDGMDFFEKLLRERMIALREEEEKNREKKKRNEKNEERRNRTSIFISSDEEDDDNGSTSGNFFPTLNNFEDWANNL